MTNEDFLRDVRGRVDARLATYFASKRDEVHALAPASLELVDAIEDLTMRGGKRLRPIVTAAVYRAVRADGDLAHVVDAGASLELLQSYLLIHDDFMDQDEERRGGPAAHVVFRDRHRDAHLGASVAILAGDLASAYAWELMLAAPFPAQRRNEGLAAFVTIQKEVYLGQHLDIVGDRDVARMHDLKTGSYTVRGPAAIGALLGDASEGQIAKLRAWADPLGEAFQLADDLLGTFGDASETGKPGDDLVHGKRNAIVMEAERTLGANERQKLAKVFGNAAANADAVSDVIGMLEATGVRRAVEARLDAKLDASLAAIDPSVFTAEGTELLRVLSRKLARRSR